MVEAMYRNLVSPLRSKDTVPDSVHLAAWPAYHATDEDRDLDERMDLVIRVVSMGRSLRTAHSLKVRQPLGALHVATRDSRARAALEELRDLVLDELNIKDLRFDERESDLVEFKVKANFKTLGPRLGKSVQKAAQAIAALPLDQVLSIEAGEPHTLTFDGQSVALQPEDVVVERHEKSGLFVACAGPVTVALDPELTPELVAEGLAREFVNRVQNLRKEAGLQVTDRIRVRYRTESAAASAALAAHAGWIRAETLAEVLEPGASVAGAATDLNGHAAQIQIEPAV
jgi:isoleucyl-tRNA synthetase